MGSSVYRKIIVLTLLFVLTSLFIYWEPSSRAGKKDRPLSHALSDIEGWKSNGVIPLEKEIVKALELDEFANQGYSNGQETIVLYIGYYLSKKKLGAAHDPLVCFPGQGWTPSETREGKLILSQTNIDFISYSSMTVEKGLKKEFIIYWFQSYDKGVANTLSQKIVSFKQRFQQKPEDNAFVRISISAENKSADECQEIVFRFIRSFYPVFLAYVKS